MSCSMPPSACGPARGVRSANWRLERVSSLPPTAPTLLSGALVLAGCVGTVEESRCPDESHCNALDPKRPNVGGAGGTEGGSPSTDPSQAGSSGGGNLPDVPTLGMQVCDQQADSAPLRPLSRWEFNNTLHQLFGDTGASLDLDPSGGASRFDNTASDMNVSSTIVAHLANVAERVAQSLTLEPLLGQECLQPASAQQEQCARDFIRRQGQRMFRRPLTAGEIDRLYSLFQSGRDAAGYEQGLRWVVEAALQSPHFIYKLEVGVPLQDDPSVSALTDFELATRLSYFLAGRGPDAELMRAAEAHELHTEEQLAAHANRLLETPEARELARHFHRQWLGVDSVSDTPKAPEHFPEFDQVRGALMEETLRFTEHLVWEGAGRVTDLFVRSQSVMNAELARFYRMTDAASSDAFGPVALDARRHSGVLSQGAVMASLAHRDETSPVRRGKFVREQLLCQKMPDPPAVVPELPVVDEKASLRERLSQHRADPVCNGCHQLLDTLGTAFEHFGPDGRWRSTDLHGNPIDATAHLIENNEDGHVDGVVELGELLAHDLRARSCVPTQWMRYALGREETEAETCLIRQATEKLGPEGGTLRDVIAGIVRLPAFRLRQTMEAEGVCE